MLPTLTVNRSFMREFIAADAPCFALGMVEERGRRCGLLALRPEEEIPSEVSGAGIGRCSNLSGYYTQPSPRCIGTTTRLLNRSDPRVRNRKSVVNAVSAVKDALV